MYTYERSLGKKLTIAGDSHFGLYYCFFMECLGRKVNLDVIFDLCHIDLSQE